MSYDAQPGYPYTPKFRITDSFGSPVTSGETGTLTLTGPTGTTLTSGALAHQGDGYWGLVVAGSFLTAVGTYKWTTGAITGTVALGAQGGTFEVGRGDLWSLREIYTAVRRGLRDGWTGTATTTGTTTTITSTRFAWGSANNWIDSEILILEPVGVTDLNPVRVTGFNQTSGTFTFANQPITLASTAIGIDFIVGNKEGQGFTHDEVMDAIVTAVRRRRGSTTVVDETSLTYDTQTLEYAVPTTMTKVTNLEYQTPGSRTGEWAGIAERFWEWDPERRAIKFTRSGGGYYSGYTASYATGRYGAGFAIPQGSKLRLTGTTPPLIPSAMGDLIRADGATIRDDALYELLSMSDDTLDRQRAAMLGNGVMRARMGAGFGKL